MLKESILFVASTGLLIYIFTPSDEPSKVEPVKEQVQETVEPAVQTSDVSWDYDEDETADDDTFVFGEPMTVTDSPGNEESGDEDSSANRLVPATDSGPKSRSYVSGGNQPAANNPRPGAPGSIENPLESKPRRSSDY
jgi:hypothetical protein